MKQGQNPRRMRGHRGNGRRPNFQGRGYTCESNGPEGKIRGTAHQVIEKYQALARDALASGDRVAAENYFQHAEHYHRLIAANTWDQRGGRPAPAQQADGAEPEDGAEAAPVAPSNSGDGAAEGEDGHLQA